MINNYLRRVNNKIKAHLAVSTVALIYGANYVIAKDVMTSGVISPEGFIMLRIIGAGALFWMIHPFVTTERMSRKDIMYTALCSIFGIAINQLCFFKGLSLTSPMHASLIMITTPMMVLMGSFLLLKNKISKKQIFGILLGLVGAWILISNAGVTDDLSSIKGDMFIFINAASYSLYLLLVKRLMEKYNELTVFKWIFLFGGLFAAPIGLPDLLMTDISLLIGEHIRAVVFVIIGATFIVYLFNGYALARISPSTVSFYIYFQPLIASFISIGLGQDSLDITKITAAVFLFTGVYFVIQNQN